MDISETPGAECDRAMEAWRQIVIPEPAPRGWRLPAFDPLGFTGLLAAIAVQILGMLSVMGVVMFFAWLAAGGPR